MHIPEIIEVKEHLDRLKDSGILSAWELPYENLLTRRSAAIFFVTPAANDSGERIWQELDRYAEFSVRPNTEKKLSALDYRLTFSKEEKEKNSVKTVDEPAA